jgi:subtilisin family serine protease
MAIGNVVGVLGFSVAFAVMVWSQPARSADAATGEFMLKKASPALIARLQRLEPVDVIVELDAAAIEAQADTFRKSRGVVHDDALILRYKADRYRAAKDDLFNTMLPRQFVVLRDYRHLPMFALRLNALSDLDALAQRPQVVAVYEDQPMHMHVAQSAPLVRQTLAATLNQAGAGTTVAVLDTGVDYTRAAFGSCTAPGVPATCKVGYAQDFAPDDGARDDNGHGSNVAGIVVGIAPGSKIAALDVFDGSTASTLDIVDAINWAIGNQAAYNIVAVNMSLGGSLYSSPCRTSNPFRTPIINAKSAGILSVASSGNEGSTSSLSIPACTPEAVAVGAVYDANVGAFSYPAVCSDATTAADKVVCFSNSASFLSLLAPGALITAAGATYAGTSQAAPHVSGAVGLLRSAYPSESVDATVTRLTSRGVNITDPRNSLVKPRIDVLAALGAVNDQFAAAVSLAGQSGSVYAYNIDATKEAGEPAHAGNSGGKSVWWAWTPPLTGPVILTTLGSDFDTLLAVYTGSNPASLSLTAENNNNPPGSTSAVSFTATAGTNYHIAVDGVAATWGTIKLTWSYLDSDGDGVIDALDNCVSIANPTQANFDGDSLGDACDPDDDNDQMPDAWEIANGLNPFDPSDAAADPDGDGATNLAEYLGGTDPRTADFVNADIPLLPPWAMAMLAALVIAGGLAGRTRGHRQ